METAVPRANEMRYVASVFASKIAMPPGAALSALALEERRRDRLRYKDGPAVAKLLGVPERTVKVGLHRLRQRLRKVISEQP